MGNKPIINSYCAAERLYAGEYPGDKGQEKAKDKLEAFLDFGITHFIDLTEEGELEPYALLLPEGVVHRRFPIVDVSVPDSYEQMQDIIDYIDEALNSSPNAKAYVHCWGGVGRTGTVVGCYYVHKGCDFVSALVRLRESFKQCPKSERRKTPETLEQEKFIADYARIRDRIDDNVESIVSETTNEIREVKIMTPDKDRIRGSLIGGGWVGDEALAIALYCAAKHFDDFEKAMIAAVNHAGDSDSIGSIAGNILGAAIGYDALPEFYNKDLELHDVILTVADDL